MSCGCMLIFERLQRLHVCHVVYRHMHLQIQEQDLSCQKPSSKVPLGGAVNLSDIEMPDIIVALISFNR